MTRSIGQIVQDEVDAMDDAEDLHDAIVWIADMVVGNGMHKANLPRGVALLVAQRMVDDPNLGWPDAECALAELESEGNVANAENQEDR